MGVHKLDIHFFPPKGKGRGAIKPFVISQQEVVEADDEHENAIANPKKRKGGEVTRQLGGDEQVMHNQVTNELLVGDEVDHEATTRQLRRRKEGSTYKGTRLGASDSESERNSGDSDTETQSL